MSNIIIALLAFVAFLMSGLIAQSVCHWISGRRRVDTLGFLVGSFSLSFISYLLLFPAYKDKYLSILSASFGAKQDLLIVVTAPMILVSIFVVPLLLGFFLGILGRLQLHLLLLGLVERIAGFLVQRESMPMSVVKASASVGSLCRSAIDRRHPLAGDGEVWDSVFASLESQVWIHVPVGEVVYEGLAVEASGYPHQKQVFLENVTVLRDGKPVPKPEGLKGVLVIFRETTPQVIEIYG